MPKVFHSIVSITIFSVLSAGFAASQNLRNPESVTITIGEDNLKGSSVNVDFNKEEVFRAWWKYSREFSRTQTQKEQVMHTIPAVDGESTEPVIFYSRVEKINNNASRVSAALGENGMNGDDVKEYQRQIEDLLIDFRLDFYTNNLQRKITETEKKAARISRSLNKHISQGYKLQKELHTAQTEPEQVQLATSIRNSLKDNLQIQDSIKLQLSAIQKAIESYKKTLGNLN